MKKTLVVIALNYQRFQYFIELIDGSQWENVVCIKEAHEMMGRSPLTTYVLLLNEYNMNPQWAKIKKEILDQGHFVSKGFI